MVERRLATILAADVAGYSRLMARDDEGTLARLERHRRLIIETIEAHRGRPFGEAGDSILAEFASPVAAVRCAIDLQLALDALDSSRGQAEPMQWRFGINLGDVMQHGRDLAGDGVNVAARLQTLAQPGGICLSAAVAEQVRGQVAIEFEDLGQHALKNLDRPVKALRIHLPSESLAKPPYRGLEAFGSDDADLYFGRDNAVAEVVERLQARLRAGLAFLMVYGAGGAGKTSLVGAGVLPALGPGFAVGFDRWLRARCRPGTEPAAALESALAVLAEAGLSTGPDGEIRALLDEMAESPGQRLQALQQRLAAARTGIVLFVDSMEELLVDPTPAAVGFVRIVDGLARSGCCIVIATLRGDFFHRCSEIPGLARLRDGLGSWELSAPGTAEIGQMIRGPARRVGLQFEATKAEGRLDDVLQHDAIQGAVPLPLLSFTMAALCARARDPKLLTFADYRALGGFAGAIARRAEEVVRDLPAATLAAFPRLLRTLVTLDPSGAIVARTIPESAIGRSAAERDLLGALTEARLLVRDRAPTGDGSIRLAHEALINHWPRAAEAIATDRRLLGVRSELLPQASRWAIEGRGADLLLGAGRRLAEAEDLLGQRGDELEADLEAFIRASTAARDHAAQRAVQRRRLIAATLVVLVLVSGALAVSATMARRQAEQAVARATASEQAAIAAREVAEAERDRAEAATSRLLALRSNEAVEAGRPQEALGLALQALTRAIEDPRRGPDTAEADQALQRALGAMRRRAVLRFDGLPMAAADFEPGGPRIATASQNGQVRLWDAAKGTVVETLEPMSADVRFLDFSPDGTLLAGASVDKTARIWNLADGGSHLDLAGHTDRLNSAEFSPDGKLLATASYDGEARLWDVATGTSLRRLAAGDGNLWIATFSPDGSRLLTSGEDGTVRVWDVATGTEIAAIEAHKARVWSAAFSPDGRLAATGAHDRTAIIWDLATGKPVHTLTGHKDWVVSVAFSPDGRWLATSSADRTIRLWDVASGALVGILRGHEQRVWRALFDASGSTLLSPAQDGSASVWDLEGLLPDQVIDGEGGGRIAALSNDGQLVAIGSPTGALELRTTADGAVRWRLPKAHAGEVLDLAFITENRLVSIGSDGAARIWRLDAPGQGHELPVTGGGLVALAASADGRRLAAADGRGAIRVWDVEGQLVWHDIASAAATIRDIAFTTDAAGIVTAGDDGFVRLLDVRDGRETGRHLGNAGTLSHVAAAEAHIVAGGVDGRLHVIPLEADAPATVIEPLHGQIAGLAVAAGSPRVAVGFVDGHAGLWDLETGGGLALWSEVGGALSSVALAPDERHLVTTAADGTTRLWPLPEAGRYDALLAEAQRLEDGKSGLHVAGGQ